MVKNVSWTWLWVWNSDNVAYKQVTDVCDGLQLWLRNNKKFWYCILSCNFWILNSWKLTKHWFWLTEVQCGSLFSNRYQCLVKSWLSEAIIRYLVCVELCCSMKFFVLNFRSATNRVFVWWSDTIWAASTNTWLWTNTTNTCIWADTSNVCFWAAGTDVCIWGTATASITIQYVFRWAIWPTATAVFYLSTPTITTDDYVQHWTHHSNGTSCTSGCAFAWSRDSSE